MFSSIPNLHLLDASSIPTLTTPSTSCDQQEYLQTWPKSPLVENHSLRQHGRQDGLIMWLKLSLSTSKIDGSLPFSTVWSRVSAAFGLPRNWVSGWLACRRFTGEYAQGPLWWGTREAGRANGEAELWCTWNRGPTGSYGVPRPCRVVPIEAQEQTSPTEGLMWATPRGISGDEAASCTKAIPRGLSHEPPAASTPGSRDEHRSWVGNHSSHDSIWLSQDWDLSVSRTSVIPVHATKYHDRGSNPNGSYLNTWTRNIYWVKIHVILSKTYCAQTQCSLLYHSLFHQSTIYSHKYIICEDALPGSPHCSQREYGSAIDFLAPIWLSSWGANYRWWGVFRVCSLAFSLISVLNDKT